MQMRWRKKFREGSLFGDASANNIRGTCAAWILEGHQQQESDFDRDEQCYATLQKLNVISCNYRHLYHHHRHQHRHHQHHHHLHHLTSATANVIMAITMSNT